MKHNGIEITVDTETGVFSAVTDDGVITKPSLAAMKKALDTTKVFKEFTAWVYDGNWYGSPLKRVMVVGIKEAGTRRYDRTPQWKIRGLKDTNYTNTVYHAFPDTPETLKLLQAKQKLDKMHSDEMDALRKLYDKENKRLEAEIDKVKLLPVPKK